MAELTRAQLIRAATIYQEIERLDKSIDRLRLARKVSATGLDSRGDSLGSLTKDRTEREAEAQTWPSPEAAQLHALLLRPLHLRREALSRELNQLNLAGLS